MTHVVTQGGSPFGLNYNSDIVVEYYRYFSKALHLIDFMGILGRY